MPRHYGVFGGEYIKDEGSTGVFGSNTEWRELRREKYKEMN